MGSMRFFCVASFMVTLFGNVISSPNIPVEEMNALHDLYNSTNGANWLWSDNPSDGIKWNFTSPSTNNPCTEGWQGIDCTFISPYQFYHVHGITLPVFNLVGNLPNSLGAFSELSNLFLYYNALTGTIPSSLGNLTQLQYLQLFGNLLTGTIPETLGNLSQLVDLDLGTNQLTGPIPEDLGNLTLLDSLFLNDNLIANGIPASLGNLILLEYLDLDNNQLTNTIPDSLGNLQLLFGLGLHINQISGTIPATFGQLASLVYLGLQFNHLTGSIPASLGNLTLLQSLDMETNRLNGTIPSSLESLSQLQILVLRDNYLSGFLPAPIGNLNQLMFMDFGVNRLSGTIPPSYGGLTSLHFLYLYVNRLHGTIPETLGNLQQVLALNFDNNKLTGTVPPSIGTILQLRSFSADHNRIGGHIPVALCNLPYLRYLSVSNNALTGTLPGIFSTNLQHLQANDNQLSGTIPSMVHLPSLLVVLLQNNQFTGDLDHVFDPTTQFQIATIVLNNNQLSGTLPAAVFQLKPQTFVGTSNCFEGLLPVSAICSNMNFVSFVIDGMSAAASCRNKLFVGPLSAYTLEHSVGGSLPTCLFQLPNITTLHLSGNGFTGSIPDNIRFSATLTDLSLSHNALTGTIPIQIQHRKWNNIDLSYNRLSGTLSLGFASNGSIELENNRLSGDIPEQFRTLASISMLGSNTFSCSYDQSDLPGKDSDRLHYHCGSNSFDSLYYTWLVAVVCSTVLLGYFEWKNGMLRSILSRDVLLRDTNLYSTLATICSVSLRCTLYAVLVLLPLYGLCSTRYGTQTYEYAYQVSGVYMSGVVPFALDWLFWWILLAGMWLMLRYTPTSPLIISTISTKSAYHSARQTVSILIPYLLIDCIVVVGVNAAYVYVAVYERSTLLTIVQTLLSIFKIVWGKWALPNLLAALTRERKNSKIQVFTEIMVNILNNIAIPCLVVAVVSPNCFYNAFVAAPEVTSTVYYKECTSINGVTGQCLQNEQDPIPTSYHPPFTYNYQCSASLVTYYSPAFVSMCIVSTFVTPLVQLLCQWLHSRAIPGTYWHRLLDSSLPSIAKPEREDSGDTTENIYLNTSGLVTTLVSTLALILTFGVMFPPLCVALTLSIFATVFFVRIHVSRFIYHSNQFDEKLFDVIRTECNSVDSMKVLKGSVWVLITVSCWFYTIFLFDTLGDAVGFQGAYWVLIVMPMMPLVVYGVYLYVSKFLRPVTYRSDPDNSKAQDVEIEMQTTCVHNILVTNEVAGSNSGGNV